MKCSKCKKNFQEKDLQLSHDVPCYLFEGNRKGRSNQADKFGRKWLCKDCHQRYEKVLQFYLRDRAIIFSEAYFKERETNDTTTT